MSSSPRPHTAALTRGTRFAVTGIACAMMVPSSVHALEVLVSDAVSLSSLSDAAKGALESLALQGIGLALVAFLSGVAIELWQRQSFTWNISELSPHIHASARAASSGLALGLCMLWLAAGRPTTAAIAIGGTVGLSLLAIASGRLSVELQRRERRREEEQQTRPAHGPTQERSLP